MGKYYQAFLIGLQGNLVYRWNFAMRAGFSLLHLVFVFLLWGAAFVGQTEIGGFNLAQTLTYFVTVLVMQFFIGAFNEDFEIGEEIRNGMINQFLLKPMNYYGYRFSVFAAARMVSGGLALAGVLVVLPLLGGELSWGNFGWERILFGAPALAMSAVIQFSIAFCFGLLAFWFLEIQSFVILSYAVETMLGGQVFPLDLLPPVVFRVSQFLPYYYQMYFPAAVITGRVEGAMIWEGLCIQAVWVLLLLGLARFLWRRGLRRYSAVGG